MSSTSDTSLIDFAAFAAVDMRAGTIVSADPFPEARKPAYRLQVDFGPEIGVKKSSAQITVRYTCEELVGMRVVGVVNFPPRQIGPMRSEVLVLGFPDANGDVGLVHPEADIPNGARLF